MQMLFPHQLATCKRNQQKKKQGESSPSLNRKQDRIKPNIHRSIDRRCLNCWSTCVHNNTEIKLENFKFYVFHCNIFTGKDP